MSIPKTSAKDDSTDKPPKPRNVWFNSALPKGYDLTDHLLGEIGPARPLGGRIRPLLSLLASIRPVPNSWLIGEASTEPDGGIYPVDCDNYHDLINAWRKAMKWTVGLDNALTVMLAAILSTKLIGDQLWIKVIGPASCGKSTLAEALSVCTEYVVAKSTIRGFHTGWKSKDGEDHSLIAEIRGKALIQKDGDTLLKMPNRDQTLAEARDLYDGASRSHYKNEEGTNYSNIRTVWILCGTNSLTSLDSSELGERMLTVLVMEGIDDELEDEVLQRVGYRAKRNAAIESDSDGASQYDPALVRAMELTGGYVRYLRQNASAILSKIEMSDEAVQRCIDLGKFVAFMRARPSKDQGENSEREFAARLVSQHVRLATCVAGVMNRKRVDDVVMTRVDRVGFNTCRGLSMEIVSAIYHSDAGLARSAVHTALGGDKQPINKMLSFLVKIKVLKVNKKVKPLRFELHTRMARLYEKVMEVT